MEKVCLPFWRRADEDPSPAVAWAVDELLPSVGAAPRVRAATLHVESADHAALRYGAGADGLLLAGLLSVWLDSYHDVADVETLFAGGPLATWHGYLVSESIPTPYADAFTWSEGERSPGLSIVTLIDKPAALSEPEFYRLWHEVHRLTTRDCHPFWCYVRNEVVRPLTDAAPGYRGIVTEAAATEEDLTDPHRFYVSGGDADVLKQNQKRVFSEVAQFIDMTTIQVVPAHEHVVRRLAPTSP